VAAFADANLTLTLPSGRAITYPEAKLVPSKYDDAPSDVLFMDNARGQWKPYRGWFGTFVENVVQGVARDLLAAAIDRFESHGINVALHCHDEVTVEVPIGSISDAAFLEILLELPSWATGLPVAGKVHSGSHYLAPPEQPAEPLATPGADASVLAEAIDTYIEIQREHLDPIIKADALQDEDDISDGIVPLPELVTLPLTSSNSVCCPFHDDVEPSCRIYPDHFYCFGCGEHGGWLDWLTRAEGMTEAEAIDYVRDWPRPIGVPQNHDASEQLDFIKKIWTSARPLLGSIAERFLDETRGIDISKMPTDIHRTLRFHPNCVFGPGTLLPCLIALMRDPLTDAPLGIQRIALVERAGRIEKIDRRMLGRGGVVKLYPAAERLVVGEGIETTLAGATRISRWGALLQPAWSAVASGVLSNLPPIPGVERLVILVDNDVNGAGQAAALRCAERWSRAGREVVRLTPKHPGTDFNDLIMGMAS
jgi:hypothetical protein